LRGFADSFRREVFQELLTLEIKHRRCLNENPTPEEYSSRFPSEEQAIADVFSSFGGDELVCGPGDLGRGFLVAILAYQTGFIPRDELIELCKSIGPEGEKPAAELLADGGHVSPGILDLLAALVDRHLEDHGHDWRESLTSLSSVVDVLAEIASVADPSLRKLLSEVDTNAAVRQEAARVATRQPAPPAAGPERFSSIRFHRRGGLGQVWLAEDQELRRRVALKELRKEHLDKAESRLRFVAEARITGALEHPGVVPVHAFGVHADGRPYYAMRFIQGENLGEVIKRFHAPQRAAISSSQRLLELRGLLGRFTSVCNTVHFAHSHQVVHRDLKPENIMLGRYGETLVVDWGLAKLVDGGNGLESTDETSAYTFCNLSPEADNVETRLGSIMGTLHYMSPEQAAGIPGSASPASDIYSLGATLYCLLVGQPPQTGKDSAVVLEKVQRSEFPRPREVQREVPRVLEAICLHAMAREPSERYATAQDMALDIDRWLADEPVPVYRESRWERLARWIRRRSHWMQAFVLMLIMATAVFLVAAIFINNARQGEAVSHRLASQESAKSKEISKFLLSLFQASDPVGFATGTATEFRGREFHSDVSARELLDRGAHRIEEELADQPELRTELLDQIGGVYRTLGLFDTAIELHRRALEDRREILPAQHPDIATWLGLGMQR
jgi:serine/threonine-protein kinase